MGGAGNQAETACVRAVKSRLTIETMSLCALYLRYTRNQVLNDPVSRDQFSGANEEREISIFPVQLTSSRTDNLTRLIHTLLCVHICTSLCAA